MDDSNPSDAVAAQLREGSALQSLGRHYEAVAAYERALQLHPGMVEAELPRGRSLAAMNRHAQALASYERVLQSRPGSLEALVARGNCLQRLNRNSEALECYDHALQLHPDRAGIHNNRGMALRGLKRYADAATAFEQLAAAKPDFEYANSNVLHARLHACDWRDYAPLVADVRRRALAGERADLPFSFLAISDSLAEQLACARRYVADQHPPAPVPMWRGQARRPGRIRLAYVSADLREHAASYLLAGLFERHDRSRFETIAFSIGPEGKGPMRTRLRAAFDRFVDARNLGDYEAASLLRELDVDILVDLMGFTTSSRPDIFALRPARVQVTYIGFPGTSAAPYFDYVVADECVLPPTHASAFSECVAWLPESYLASDDTCAIAEHTPTREQMGLPAEGFVFCCFNNSYKLNPETWSAWMRLLRKVTGSVLWLYQDSDDAARNLRAEAELAGVAPERLVFATRLPHGEHLARHRLADLFLDTLPYNAHTTASDALWAGLPVLTRIGKVFAGRVAASLLRALGLDELVCADLPAYEAMALRLATEPEALLELRRKLAEARRSAPLFDTDRFRRHLESAYLAMWQRHLDGEAPVSFRVDAIS